MTFHIPCLKEVLLLCVLVFPSAFLYFVKPWFSSKLHSLMAENVSTILVYGLLLLLSFGMGAFSPAKCTACVPGGYLVLCLAAIAAGGGNVAAEYLMAALPVRRKSGTMPKAHPPSLYREHLSVLSVISILAAASAEELIFRGVIQGSIFPALGFPAWLGLLLSAFFYAMNHVYFGRFTVLQKMVSGLVFSALFLTGGGWILPSILCHAAQNLILYCWAVRTTSQTTQSRKGDLPCKP
ncbi:MAG: type II CAAX endopeptidase family protein [Eubacteriales bacterium]|nr:type II CAAX endopeptidase family protein [Eubacteriales bacterium]